ncbi:MAG: hypothetical protein AAF871_06440 [Pseudomonadota bacterium]
MQRLALAILLVAALVGLAAVVFGAMRRATGGPGLDEGVSPMQRVAYFVLIALILYVSIAGSGA